MLPFFVASGNEKMKRLGGQEVLGSCGWMAALVAPQSEKEQCPVWVELGRMEAASPLTFLCFLDCASHAQGCSVRGRLFSTCTYTGTDHHCFSSGVQRSCVPGPEEGVCGYRLQLQAVSAQWVGRRQAHISHPLLEPSPCWQSLIFYEHPSAIGFSLLCV